MNIILMHMSDGLISINIGVVFTVISLIMLVYSMKKMKENQDEKKIPMMAVMAAFIFACQMINFTIPGTGSSGHIGGAILLCMILGHFPAFISLSCVLIIQCLLFGDGGLLALGCNIFNMGVIPCFIVYPLIIKPILKKNYNPITIVLTSILGVVVALELGAFSVVLQTVCSKVTQLPFHQFVLLMLPIHFAIGLVEGVITSLICLYVYRDNHQILTQALNNQYTSSPVKKLMTVFIVLALLVGGGLSLYASSQPDGLEWSILNITGKEDIDNSNQTKDKIKQIQNQITILPDYSFKNKDSLSGTTVSGIFGVAATCMLGGLVGYVVLKKKNEKNH